MDKICTRCGDLKDKKNFAKSGQYLKDGTPGLRGQCKICDKKFNKKRVLTEEQKIKQRLNSKKHYEKNKEKITDRAKVRAKENKEKLKEYKKLYRSKNKDKIKQKDKIYQERNKEKLNKRSREYMAEKRKNLPRKIRYICRTVKIIQNSIKSIISKNSKHKPLLTLLKKMPYSSLELKSYLESKFEPWMNWNNFGPYLKSNFKLDDSSTWTWTIQFLYELPLSLNIQIPSEEFDKYISFENMKPISSLEILKEKRKKNYEKVKNNDDFVNKRQEYITKNKDKISAKAHIKYCKNRSNYLEYHKNYREKNKKKISEKKLIYTKQKLKTDMAYKLRAILRTAIYTALKRNNSTKNNLSILKFLPYSMQELKEHLEKQFEPWMSWNNWTNYNPKTWKDEDQTTWTWNIDHIIPQCDLKYTTMDEENFFKCWALENLRPYSAKLNIIEQDRK